MALQTGPAIQGYIGYATETTKGTFVAPAAASGKGFLMNESNTLDSTPDIIRKVLLSGSRDAERLVLATIFKQTGQLSYPAYVNQGNTFYKAGLGVSTAVVKASDTIKTGTPVSTANNISTVAVTNTSGTIPYKAGMLVGIGVTGGPYEYRVIQTAPATPAAGEAFTVSALVTGASLAAGNDCIVFPGYMISPTAPGTYTLPTLSIENNLGGQFSERYAGTYVSKIEIKGDKDLITTTVDLYSTVKRIKGTPTAFAPSANALNDPQYSFTNQGISVIAYNDYNASGAGTSGVSAFADVEDWTITIDNGLIEKPRLDGTGVYQAWPGTRKVTLSYKYINEAQRSVEWEDFLSNLQSQSQLNPFLAWGQAGATASTTPASRNFVVSIPQVKYVGHKAVNVSGDVIGAEITGEAVYTGSGDIIDIFLTQTDGSTFTGDIP